jgi:hypothetical protein
MIGKMTEYKKPEIKGEKKSRSYGTCLIYYKVYMGGGGVRFNNKITPSGHIRLSP